MKKTYEKPQILIVPLRRPVLMLGGSHTVNDYDRSGDIIVGDED